MAIGHKEAYDKDSDSVRMRHMLFGLHQKLVVDGCWLAPTLTMQQLLSSSLDSNPEYCRVHRATMEEWKSKSSVPTIARSPNR